MGDKSSRGGDLVSIIGHATTSQIKDDDKTARTKTRKTHERTTRSSYNESFRGNLMGEEWGKGFGKYCLLQKGWEGCNNKPEEG